jgi:hypothetical protein
MDHFDDKNRNRQQQGQQGTRGGIPGGLHDPQRGRQDNPAQGSRTPPTQHGNPSVGGSQRDTQHGLDRDKDTHDEDEENGDEESP